MKRLISLLLPLALLTGGPALAASYTLDFTGSGAVPDTFGDNSEADLSYRGITQSGYGDVATNGELRFWTTGYGDLDGAVYSNVNGSHGEVRIEAIDPSMWVTIDSFDMGGWVTDELAEWRIFDLTWNLIASGSGTAPNTGSRLSVAPNSGAQGGVIFQWGADAWDVGVENFSYTVSSTPVPLPAPALLLIAGLAGIGALRRRSA